MDIAIKHIHELLGFFKESSFENCNIAKQISTGLEIEIEFKGCHIPRKRTFSYETLK